MTRDELLLAALAEDEGSTAELGALTRLPERTARAGLYRLVRSGYAWSPARGLWRLTASGRAIAAELPGLDDLDSPDPPLDARL